MSPDSGQFADRTGILIGVALDHHTFLGKIMGLAERRAVKAFSEGKYPQIKQEIDAAAGFDLSIEVNWDSLAVDDYAHLYEEAFSKVYFRPLLDAIKGVGIDELGRSALKDGLKQVIIENSGSSWPTFQSGVLTLPFHAVANLDDWLDRKKEIQSVLEKGL
jgi:hypothetical protein